MKLYKITFKKHHNRHLSPNPKIKIIKDLTKQEAQDWTAYLNYKKATYKITSYLK